MNIPRKSKKKISLFIIVLISLLTGVLLFLFFDKNSVTTFSTDTPSTKTTSTKEEKISVKDLVINIGVSEESRYLTWYSKEESMTVELTIGSNLTEEEFLKSKKEVFQSEGEDSNKKGYNTFHVEFTNLEESTDYAYSISSDKGMTKVMYFHTSICSDQSFQFFALGDPQIGASGDENSDRENLSKTIEKGISQLGTPDFLLTLGDQVDSSSDESEYTNFLKAIPNELSLGTVIGNHDTASDSYAQHFTLPNETEEGNTNAGGDYTFEYENTQFLVLNMNNEIVSEHEKFLRENYNSQENIKWHVVLFHQSIFSVGDHVTELVPLREALVPVLSEFDIDVVFTGHDHLYARTYPMDGLTPQIEEMDSKSEERKGIIYLTLGSSSGSKYYPITGSDYKYCIVESQEEMPYITKVEVSEDSFTVNTYVREEGELRLIDKMEL